MKNLLKTAAAVVAVVALVACNSQKVPADAAIKAADGALGAARADAAKYVPDALKAAEDALKVAKDEFAKGDFEGALKAATDAGAKAKDLAGAVAAKKVDLTKAWDDVSASLPKMVEAIKSRVEMLSKSKKLPKGLDKDALAKGKEGLAAAQGAWDEAQKAFAAGDISGALDKANGLKAKATEVMALLGMQEGGAPAPAEAAKAPAKPAAKPVAKKHAK